MKVLALPQTEKQIKDIVRDPDAYVRRTRQIKQRRAKARRARILESSKGTLIKWDTK